MEPFTVVSLIYPGMTVQDLVGPMQVWSALPGAQITYAAKDTAPMRTDCGLTIVADADYASAPASPDILFVPGGGEPTIALLEDQDTLAFLAARGAHARWVTSVCTGALLLGAAGLLTGYRATSHWYSRDYLALFGATPVHERWVIDRNRATGGGVTAGIDFGLVMAKELAGETVAKAIQLGLEYAPHPPFDCGAPERADDETLALLNSVYDQRDARPAIERAAARLANR